MLVATGALLRLCFSCSQPYDARVVNQHNLIFKTRNRESDMFILKHVAREEAAREPESKIAKAYAVIPPHVPLPEPLEMMSASPELAMIQSRSLRYFITHEKLDFSFFALLRLIAADHFEYPYCLQLNTTILERAGGMSQEEIEILRRDPAKAPLEEPQLSLFLFVLKLIGDPSSITEDDVNALRNKGWDDKDIFDAAYHAAMMQGPSMLFKAFIK